MSKHGVTNNLNLGGFPNILINDEIFKKKRETSEILNESNKPTKQINILNIRDILSKKQQN